MPKPFRLEYNMCSQLSLTEEQLAVVNHNQGPALVFAVAGAGKTTAMVHRIERLVRERVFPASAILATSFSRATVADLRSELRQWPACKNVNTATLHAVGYRVVQKAVREGLIADLRLPDEQGQSPDRLLLQRTLGRARQERIDVPPHFDETDFLSYVGLCKGNFRYPSTLPLDLPEKALVLLSQAEAPGDWPIYLDLFVIFEELRQEMGLLTFDDMLLTAWELMHKHSDLLSSVQSRYQAVLVDEFQDINHVQSELLDLIVAPHSNYMAIGDDDQTIYEWRGADPRFILEFSQRYTAHKYLLRDNFRSRASHLALANAVICHNSKREPKALQLTQGFSGLTRIHRSEDAEALGKALAQEVQSALTRGFSLKEMAVLLRIYAQTAFIEQALNEAQIPYRIDGSVPFFQRAEVQVLLAYLRLARIELQIQQGHTLTASEITALAQDWKLTVNRPLRYISAAQNEAILQAVASGLSLTGALHEIAGLAEKIYISRNLEKLADLITWLGIQIQLDPANLVLIALEDRLEYCAWLRKSSGFPENGEAKASTVEALLDYAREKGSVTAFLNYLERMSLQTENKNAEALVLTTIYRAKGLEWNVVFVPHCNQGFLPYGRGETRIEEERRLFYVAVTRPRDELHLLLMSSAPVSRFLREAGYHETLEDVQQIRKALNQAPKDWKTPEVLSLARHASRLHFERYLLHWWNDPDSRELAAQKIASLFQAAGDMSLIEQLELDKSQFKRWQGAMSLPLEPELFADLSEHTGLPKPLLPQTKHTIEGFKVGERVRNPQYGEGEIIKLEPHIRHGLMLEVEFDLVGRKRLVSRYADLQRV
jgi:DNA helicase II / ATP-dependent DNA helicase PcrA